MAGRLSEFAEGVFQDLVGLVYGYFAAIGTLLASPARGPLRLSMRRRRRSAPPAPHIVVFTSLALFYFLASRSGGELSTAFTNLVGHDSVLPEVRALLIGAFVATVIADASIRAGLTVLGRRAKRANQRTQARLLYDVALQCTVVTIIWLVILLTYRNFRFVSDALRGRREYLVVVAVIAIAVRFSGNFLKRTDLVGRWQVLARRGALTLALSIAAVSGLLVSDWIGNLAHTTVVKTIKCQVNPDGSVDAFVLFHNRRNEPVSFDTDEMAIRIAPAFSGASWSAIKVRAVLQESSEGVPPIYILNSGDTGWLHARSDPSADMAAATPSFVDGLAADCEYTDRVLVHSLGKTEGSYMIIVPPEQLKQP